MAGDQTVRVSQSPPAHAPDPARMRSFFLTYLHRELRRRARQSLLIVLGLGLGVGLAMTVSAASAGVSRA